MLWTGLTSPQWTAMMRCKEGLDTWRSIEIVQVVYQRVVLLAPAVVTVLIPCLPPSILHV